MADDGIAVNLRLVPFLREQTGTVRAEGVMGAAPPGRAWGAIIASKLSRDDALRIVEHLAAKADTDGFIRDPRSLLEEPGIQSL